MGLRKQRTDTASGLQEPWAARSTLRLLVFSAVITIVAGCSTVTPTRSVVPGQDGTALAATEGPVIRRGDHTEIQFTCRFKDGELAISSSEGQGPTANPVLPLSRVFLPREKSTPLPLIAGEDPPEVSPSLSLRGFEGEVVHQLTNRIIGLREGERKVLELTAEKLDEKTPGEYTIQLARIRHRDKEQTLSVDEFREKTGVEPKVGQPLIDEPLLPGKVVSIKEGGVIVRFSGEDGKVVDTPFGKGTIHDKAGEYQIELNPRIGTLVRTGMFVGRIATVDNESFVIDYSHPFGGESLACDVKIESVKSATQETLPVKKTAKSER